MQEVKTQSGSLLVHRPGLGDQGSTLFSSSSAPVAAPDGTRHGAPALGTRSLETLQRDWTECGVWPFVAAAFGPSSAWGGVPLCLLGASISMSLHRKREGSAPAQISATAASPSSWPGCAMFGQDLTL